MELKLLELKRYAIDNRVEVKFADAGSGHECAINNKGLAKVLSEDKTARVEDVLAAAQTFDVTGQGKPQRLSRDAMAQAISEAFKQRGFAATSKEED